MIDKLVVHLKNIIFFKIVVYVIIITSLGLLIPIFMTDLEKALERKQKAISFLRETTLKIESIHDFEEKIAVLNHDYQALAMGEENFTCSNQMRFVKSIDGLNKKYQLCEPITIKLSKGYELDDSLVNNGYIKMNYHMADLSFKATDFHHLLTILQDVYNSMPTGSVVLGTNIRSIDALTPDIIESLTIDNIPALIEVKIKIMLRTIVYDK